MAQLTRGYVSCPKPLHLWTRGVAERRRCRAEPPAALQRPSFLGRKTWGKTGEKSEKHGETMFQNCHLIELIGIPRVSDTKMNLVTF